MSRYTAMFDRLAGSKEGAFSAFLMLGDPDLATSALLLDALVAGGADMIEVGIPFSDPVADGPVIQSAADRALRAGVTPGDCFHLLSDFRARHPSVPVGVLTYANLVIARGREKFCTDLAAAGADSLLIADVPTLEAEPFADCARSAGLDFVMIAAPNTPAPTLERIARLASGYTYCVARAGVTGTREKLALDHDRLLAELRSNGAPPAVLGFGISTPDHVRQALATEASGVITGSALVSMVERGETPAAISAFVATMKAATAL